MTIACSHCRTQLGFWLGLVGVTLCSTCRPGVRKARSQWERALRTCLADRILTLEEERELDRLASHLGLTAEDLIPLIHKYERARGLSAALVGQAPPVPANIALKANEVCWFASAAALYEERTVRQYVGASSGVSIRIAKGLSYRVGSSRGYSVPRTHVERICDGMFYITNQRCVFVSPRKTIAVKLKDLISFDAYDDGIQLHHDKSTKLQVFKFDDGEYAAAVLSGALTPVPASSQGVPATGSADTPPGPLAHARKLPQGTPALPSGRSQLLRILAVVGLFLVPPVGIALLWWQRLWSRRARIAASIASAMVFIRMLTGADSAKDEQVRPKSASVSRATAAPTLILVATSELDLSSASLRDLSERERTYFKAVRAYLESLNAAHTPLAAAINGVRDDRRPLATIKAACERSRTEQPDLYATHFARVAVPPSFATFHKQLAVCQARHDAAIDELLNYWVDGASARLEKGAQALGRAIDATNAAAQDLKATVARLTGARKKRAMAARNRARSMTDTNEEAEEAAGSPQAIRNGASTSDATMQLEDPYAAKSE